MEYAIIRYPVTEHSTGRAVWPPEADVAELPDWKSAVAAMAEAEKAHREQVPDLLDTFAIAKVVKKYPSEGFGNYADVLVFEGGTWTEEQVQYPFFV